MSYRCESAVHARAVRRLGEQLRQAGIPVMFDQFVLDEFPGGPRFGWAKWCEDCANKCGCVLIIGSEGWFAAYEKDATPMQGLGAATEADLIRQALYDNKGDNARIRLAFLHKVESSKIPTRLRQWHQFQPFDGDDQLNALIRWAADCLSLPHVEMPTISWPKPFDFETNLADREEGNEWPAVVDLLAGRSRERILLYEGESGFGKSFLVRCAAKYAKKAGIPVGFVNLKDAARDVASILRQIDLDLGEYLPNFFKNSESQTTYSLCKDLRALRTPFLLIFDGYDKDISENKGIVDWLNLQILSEVETVCGLAVIVAGQASLDFMHASWYDLARHFKLKPITEAKHWEPWLARHFPTFSEKGAHLPTVLMLAKGNPLVVSSFCEAICQS